MSVHGQDKEACGVPTLLGLALSLFGSYFRGYFFNRKSEIKKISFNAFSTLSNFFLHVTYFFLSSMSGLFWVFYQSSIEVSSMSSLFEGLFFPSHRSKSTQCQIYFRYFIYRFIYFFLLLRHNDV